MMRPLRVRLLADGASLDEMCEVSHHVAGFTTNPSLMKKAGILDYHLFAREVLALAHGRPVSFEVTVDDFAEMADQARIISSWGTNVFVKVPITNTKGNSSARLIRKLVGEGIKLNVTAILYRAQVEEVVDVLDRNVPSFISIFAGRVADTGRDPVPLMAAMADYVMRSRSGLIWASAREVLNVVQADECNVGYITLSPALLRKLSLLGKNLAEYSLETVKEFHRDAQGLGMNVHSF